MNKILNISLYTIIVLSIGGCFTLKYDAKGGVEIPAHIETFSVQYFENRAKIVEPTFSRRFTDGLKTYLESNTDLRIINGMGNINLSGMVTQYDIKTQGYAKGDKSATTRFTITVEMEYSDQKVPENDFEKKISVYREFESTESFSSVEANLSDEMIEELIELIFNAAFVNW